MRLIIVIVLFCFTDCNIAPLSRNSFLDAQKENFKYQNKDEFVSDRNLSLNYKTLKKSWHPLFVKVTSTPVYLYSWQERDKNKNEFTIVKDEGELGLKIFYVIIDKNDKLISSVQIAGKGNEGGYWFETRSKFINKDTMINIGSITQWIDLKIPKGDTTFSYLVIDSNGKITEKIFKEVKALQFEIND